MMKKYGSGLLLCTVLAAALLWSACAQPPTEEMENARTAVTRAENDADALTYASSALARARAALDSMQAEAEAKRYDAAKNYAAEAISAADKALADGKTGSARAREEAAALVSSVKGTLAETQQSIDSAKTVQNIDLDFNGIDQDFETARRTTDQAELSLAGNNYADALNKCRDARGLLGDISAKIAGAATTVSRKK
jgi:hypothetical protein